MGKYINLQKAIYSFFSGLTWGLEEIPSYPQDVAITETHEKYVRISIIPGGDGINLKSVSGICIIDIYTSADLGITGPLSIADKLDEYLVGGEKYLNDSRLQFPKNSTMVPKGRDKENPNLIRHSYTIPFVYFGVT